MLRSHPPRAGLRTHSRNVPAHQAPASGSSAKCPRSHRTSVRGWSCGVSSGFPRQGGSGSIGCLDEPSLDILEPRTVVFGKWGESRSSPLGHLDHESGEVVEGSDLHALEIGAPGADLLCRFPRERDERDVARARDPGSDGVPGLLDHGVSFAGFGAGDDEGAVFLDEDGAALLLVEPPRAQSARRLQKRRRFAALRFASEAARNAR